ncbi:MAG: hypothetical protein IPG54_08765 [Sphingomonadales bacterium]|nr:hypothetical protein [Sphingomonadales bacterium]
MGPAVDAFETAMLSGQLRHAMHPLLRWCAGNTDLRNRPGRRTQAEQKPIDRPYRSNGGADYGLRLGEPDEGKRSTKGRHFMALADTFSPMVPINFWDRPLGSCFHPHPYTWTAVSICIDILCPQSTNVKLWRLLEWPPKERKLRFSGVVYAVDASPKALRKWLQPEQVDLITPRTEGGWNYFSMGDVAVLALVRSIVNFGVGVETKPPCSLHLAGNPRRALVRSGYCCERAARKWVDVLDQSRGLNLPRRTWRTFLGYEVWNMWQAFPQDAPAAALIIKPEEVLRRALERAADNADWTDDSTPSF